MYVLISCRYIKIPCKNLSASPSKDVNRCEFFIKQLYCHISIYTTIELFTAGNPVNCYLTFTMDATHHRLVNAIFSVQILKF